MTVDQYAICPCGNGKKIKFCKCKDSLPALDRVMTMIEGGQIVPAIDRLNQVLVEHPDAAWALSIKGRLMLELDEFDALAENAERFVRLQPSNPLALAQRAAAQVNHDDLAAATLSLLESLTESGRNVDSFVLDIASLVSYMLASEGLFLTARSYLRLPLTAEGYEKSATAASMLRQLNTDRQVNHLLKEVPRLLPRDEEAPWAERFDEAIGLLRSNQVLLAESKLQSLARTTPREACVLAGLLLCGIWRGDAQSQSECLRKLSECESLEFHDRAEYLAMSWLVVPDSEHVTKMLRVANAEIESLDEVVMAMTANRRLQSVEPDMLKQFTDENQVPPRAGFQLLNFDRPEKPITGGGPEHPRLLALVLIYGKQTDRAARIQLEGIRESVTDDVTRLMNEILPGLALNFADGARVPLIDAAISPFAMLPNHMFTEDPSNESLRLAAESLADHFVLLPLPSLGNKSVAETLDDPGTLLARTALVRLFENDERMEIATGAVELLRAKSGVAEVPPLTGLSMQDVHDLTPADLTYVDVRELAPDVLIYVLQRAREYSVNRTGMLAAQRIVTLDLAPELRPAVTVAYLMLVENAKSPDEAMSLLEKAKAFATANQFDQANLRLMELMHCLSSGDQPRFVETLQDISKQYGNRPEVMARVRQMLTSAGILRPDGSMRTPQGGSPSMAAAAPSPADTGGIWTPGSGAASAAPAGKLWVPGME